MDMDNPGTLVVILVILVLVVAGADLLARRRRSEALRRRFGPEYDHAVGTAGDRARAEAELAAREKRVAKLDIRELPEPERRRFAEAWRDVQARFVDSPAARDSAQANERGEATTDHLREAMVHYRGLFEELLGAQAVPPPATGQASVA